MLPFEPFLEYNDFAVRIAERDIPSMVDILRVREKGERKGGERRIASREGEGREVEGIAWMPELTNSSDGDSGAGDDVRMTSGPVSLSVRGSIS